MAEPGCTHCKALAAEVALGVATGRERADAVVHLQVCPECRAEVDGLTRVHDRLRALIPCAEPPVGFETRVIERIEPPRPTPDRSRQLLVAAAVAIALLGGGWGLAATMSPRPAADLASGERTVLFAPLNAHGHEVGQVYAHPGPPSWLYMYMETQGHPGTLTCTVLRRDGTSTVVGSFPVTGDDAYWGGPAPIDRTTLTAVQVTDATGEVRGTASFTTR